jgi:single-strand selective monofunctional uracil DNA glycosylase
MPQLIEITEELSDAVDHMTFDAPVTHVYNPLDYAHEPHTEYLERYGSSTPREILMVGMNPGPWGMAQTGIPFGEIAHVRDWMGIDGEVHRPSDENPNRAIEGFDCDRSEVSGRRLWSWAHERFGPAEDFFERFFVWNYCPLVFMEESGRNYTPNKLPKAKRDELFEPCDEALRGIVDYLQPQWVLGIGAFAEKRSRRALKGVDVQIGRILHPSPASPKANRGWAEQAEKEFAELGIEL